MLSIPSPNWESRQGETVRLVVVHTAETTADAVRLATYFSTTGANTSAHVCVDDTQMVQCVSYDHAAWTVRSGNHVSDNIEQCAFAAWTPEEWARHPGMLELTAAWIAERCAARGIPIRKLTPDQVAAGEWGVIGHWDWTVGEHDGTHTDPGGDYPWDQVIGRAQQIAAGSGGGGTSPTTTPRTTIVEDAMQLPVTDAPTSGVLDESAPWTEETVSLPWPGGWMASQTGIALTAGYSGAYIRLLHAQEYDSSGARTGPLDLLIGQPKLLAALERLWLPMPPGTGAVTVQYACPSSLSLLCEYKPAAA